MPIGAASTVSKLEETASKIVANIRNEAKGQEYSFMHVCGTHQDTLVRHGLDELLDGTGVRIIQGPGCPVCVTTTGELEEALCLARNGITIAVFGDMLKVPGESGSLASARTEGCDIRVVYGTEDAVKLAREQPDRDVVFAAIGFETTAPTTASMMCSGPPENFSVLSFHRTVPPALKFIADSGEVRLHGLIEPGHVSTIIGLEPYRFLTTEYGMPQVVAGFEPLDLLMGIYMLVRQASRGEAKLENEYNRVVSPDGNPTALCLMERVFIPTDIPWRGFPTIPGSGLDFRDDFSSWNARKRYAELLQPVWNKEFKEFPGCRCGDVLRGTLLPEECPMFGEQCTPSSPLGPCMVSSEGGCAIAYKYGRGAR